WCGPIRSVCFSPDGKVLATCAGLGTICLWDAHRWEPLRKFEADGIAADSSSKENPIAWAPNGAAIARVNDKQQFIEIADSQSGGVLRILSAPAQGITTLGWSPDGRLVVAGTTDGRIYSWNLTSDSNEPLTTLSAHTGRLNALAWMPQDQSLITAGDDGKIGIWEPRSGTRIRNIEGYPAPITCLSFSPEGNVLAAGSENGIIRLWDTAGGWASTLLRGEPNDVEAREAVFTAVACSPDGGILASGDSGGKIRIWDPKIRRPIRSFSANCGPISSLAWSPDGRVLLCGGADGTIRVWDAKSGFHEHVVLLPLWGSVGPGIAINAVGDYRGPPGIEDHLIYAVRTAESRQTLKPADFQSQYGWVNEPWQVGLYKPGAETIERIYVNAVSEGPYDGKTWDTAFNDLQDALSIAQPNTDIWVAAGTYTPDRGTGARTASFHMKGGVRLLGGFAGTETSSYQRDPHENETILSGDLKGDDGPDFAKNDENSHHVVTAIRTNLDTVLDGFTITGGNANGPGEFRYDEGGGIYNNEGGMTLIGCTLKFNTSTRPGGGMYHSSPGRHLSLTTCSFRNNRARVEQGHDWGGGIYIGGAKGEMKNCILEHNVAGAGGGAFLSRTSDFILRDCTFIDNRAMRSGGGLRGYTENNYALINCRFLRNSDWFHSGGVFNGVESKVTLVNCIFVGNSSRHGAGGMLNTRGRYAPSPAVLTNCTFVANSSGGAIGGFASSEDNSSMLNNCILWFNTGRDSSLELAQVQGERTDISNCCVQGWTGKLGGTGNFADNPMFIDPNGPDGKIGTIDDDMRLSHGSPCINVGDNSSLPPDTLDLDSDGDSNEPIPFDIDGKPRIKGGIVDIGAYESG
ncbi:MAG: hypothetical protein JSW66_05045, partial [Phycisphaerales bacterium]